MVAERRMLVARLRAQGLSEREIVRALASEKSPVRVNPNTGKEWSLGTVATDCKVLVEQWREKALADTATMRGEQLAELAEIKRNIWAKKFDPFALVKCLEREARLLGLDAPTKIAPTDPTGQHEYQGMSDDELVARLREIAAADAAAGAGGAELPPALPE